MVADAVPAHAPAPAHVVGYSFVCQYYTVLHNSAQYLYQFYTDDSSLTVAEADSTNAAVVQGQQAIHQKVLGLGYVDAKVEIMSVDSQYSLGGGVLVTVTGMITRKDTPRRAFAQSFFLAVQEKGYFVLNDIIRFLPPSVELKVEEEPKATPNGTLEENKAEAVSVEEEKVQEATEKEVKKDVDADASEAQEEEKVDVAQEKEEKDAPKTYASILQRMKAAAAAAVANEVSPVEKQEKAAPVPPAEPPVAEAPATPAPPSAGMEKAEVLSVFVRNIPPSMDEADVERAFSPYGKIRNGKRGISLKVQKGSSYAFVDFETSAMVQAAIAATIELGGRKLQVEEKKPVIFKKSVPGGPGTGRGRHGQAGGGRGGRGGRGTGGRGSHNNVHAANKVGPAPAVARA